MAPARFDDLRQLAETLETSATRLDQPPPKPKRKRKAGANSPTKIRRGTVCGCYRQHTANRVPDLHLSGLWLKGAGFDLGQKYEVHVEHGQLVIRFR